MKKEILGTWIDQDGTTEALENLTFDSDGFPKAKDASIEIPGVWIFSKDSENSYLLTYYDERQKPAVFEANLIKLGEHYYFNFYPTDDKKLAELEDNYELFERRFNSFEIFHFHPVNTFAKVTFEADQLQIALFDGDFLEKLLDQNRIRIKHEKVDGNYILTAKSEELQKFILKYGEDKRAFPTPTTLIRPI